MSKRVIIIVAVVILLLAWLLLVSGEQGGAAVQERADAWEGAGRAATVILSVIGVVLATGVLAVAYSAGLALWERTHEARAAVAGLGYGTRRAEIDLERQKLANSRHLLDLDRERLHVTEKIHPDPHGNFPLLWDGSRALDPNRGVVFSIDAGAESMTPALVGPAQLTGMLRAAGGWPGGAKATERLLAEPEREVRWPSRVPLRGLLENGPSYQRLAMGVSVNAEGRVEAIRDGLGNMVHIAVGGSSGSGKSVFLRAMALQLALSRPPVDLAMIDLEGATFAPFEQCERLLWPIAETEENALTIFGALGGELERRKGLYRRYPGVDSLSMYNCQHEGEALPPLVCLVDEATALLGNKDVESELRMLALRARKYGLYLLLGGQDWKASSLDTAIRNQLGARVQFRAMSASQSRILLQRSGAEELPGDGRALAWLPGRGFLEIQAPWVSRDDLLAAVNGGGPKWAMPPAPVDEMRERVLDLAGEGLTVTEIAREIHGYKNGRTVAQVKAILAE